MYTYVWYVSIDTCLLTYHMIVMYCIVTILRIQYVLWYGHARGEKKNLYSNYDSQASRVEEHRDAEQTPHRPCVCTSQRPSRHRMNGRRRKMGLRDLFLLPAAEEGQSRVYKAGTYWQASEKWQSPAASSLIGNDLYLSHVPKCLG